jgi:hypothetical protein
MQMEEAFRQAIYGAVIIIMRPRAEGAGVRRRNHSSES